MARGTDRAWRRGENGKPRWHWERLQAGDNVYQLTDNGRLMVFSSVDADDYPSMTGKRVGVAVRMQAPQPN